MPPKVLAKNDGAKGVLPVNAATRAAAAKGPAPRLKLEVRRLPPGLTLSEFEEILGDEWKLGNGKVDWREYRQGKVKQSLGKVPEQSRCYVHLVNEAAIQAFEARFLAVTFQDKAGTYRNPDIKHFPPTLGFAPNQRTTISTKVRTDNRQGTIDQDPEFIAFLEAETQPIARPSALDSVTGDTEKVEKTVVKSTPLIEALREKKAIKAKAAETKAEHLKKDGKGQVHAEGKNDTQPMKTAKDSKNQQQQQQQKLEQASKDAVKALNKQVVSKQQQAQQRPASPQQVQQQQKGNAQPKGKKGAQAAQAQNTKAQNAAPTKPVVSTPAASAQQTPAPQTPPKAPRQRGNADGIKKMLQKDLAGIRSKALPAANRTPSASTPATPSAISSPAQKDAQPKPAPTPPTAPKAQTQPRQQQHQQQQQQPAAVASTTKAYLKHANPSQGMTEILIQQALSQFGDVTNVTIDPRKGTAIALFKDPEALKKAFAAKKVPVANGSVEILEWKDRAMNNGGGNRGGFRGGRGGARGGRGGGNATPAATPAPKSGGGGARGGRGGGNATPAATPAPKSGGGA